MHDKKDGGGDGSLCRHAITSTRLAGFRDLDEKMAGKQKTIYIYIYMYVCVCVCACVYVCMYVQICEYIQNVQNG